MKKINKGLSYEDEVIKKLKPYAKKVPQNYKQGDVFIDIPEVISFFGEIKSKLGAFWGSSVTSGTIKRKGYIPKKDNQEEYTFKIPTKNFLYKCIAENYPEKIQEVNKAVCPKTGKLTFKEGTREIIERFIVSNSWSTSYYKNKDVSCFIIKDKVFFSDETHPFLEYISEELLPLIIFPTNLEVTIRCRERPLGGDKGWNVTWSQTPIGLKKLYEKNPLTIELFHTVLRAIEHTWGVKCQKE